ncbi:MAG: response regulator [bacterium]
MHHQRARHHRAPAHRHRAPPHLAARVPVEHLTRRRLERAHRILRRDWVFRDRLTRKRRRCDRLVPLRIGSMRSPARGAPLTAQRVLFVDDMPDMGALIVDVLLLDGIEVDWCAGADEAMARLEKEGYDALVTDLGLGGSGPDGEELAKHAADAYPDLPILFITGDGEAVRRLKREGAQAMLKPVDIDMLLDWLRSADRRGQDS